MMRSLKKKAKATMLLKMIAKMKPQLRKRRRHQLKVKKLRLLRRMMKKKNPILKTKRVPKSQVAQTMMKMRTQRKMLPNPTRRLIVRRMRK